jgi:hypothetical protein
MAITQIDVTIPNGGSVSNIAAAPAGSKLVGLQMPAAWTAAICGIEAGFSISHLGQVLTSLGSSQLAAIASADAKPDRVMMLPGSWTNDTRAVEPWFQLTHFQVRSGTDLAPVNQGGDRVVSLFFLV